MNFVDHHSWLVDSNLVTEEMKNNIGMLAYCLIEDTIEASTDINFEKKLVNYRLIIPHKLFEDLQMLKKYEDTGKLGFFEMRRLRAFLVKKRQNDESGLGYKLDDIANKFIKAYFNNSWNATVEFKSIKGYDSKKDIWLHSASDQQSN